ncbi:MAG: serine/threonine protein kinase [Planctomycetes bacterium]|nr:serine/threonine protein kinase [Planctomycetota bacterium]
MKCPICKKELENFSERCRFCGCYLKNHKQKPPMQKNPASAKMQTGNASSSRQITRTPQLQSAIENLPKPLHNKLNKEIEKIPEVKLVERFEIIEKLGRGGMGEVFKAREKGLNRIVAIKRLIIKEEMAYYGIMRFFREAQTLARLNHLNIVNIFQNARDEFGLYIVMEYIDGITLSKLIRIRGALSRAECIHIIMSTAKALEFAHNLNIIHRDVKPGNVMLQGAGLSNLNSSKKLTSEEIKNSLKELTVKVLDFGLAKLKTGRSLSISAVYDKTKPNINIPVDMKDTMTQEVELSVSGSLIGTMVYASPEQKSNPKYVDKRADIYSLGLLFYQVLVGEVPKQVDFKKIPIVFRNLIESIDPDVKRRISSATEFMEILTELMREEERFEDVKKGSAADCRDFLHEYPKSIFIPEIKRCLEYKVLEEEEYRNAVNGTSTECDAYLANFRNGRFIQQVYELRQHKKRYENMFFEIIKIFLIGVISGSIFGLIVTASIFGMFLGSIAGFFGGFGIYWYKYRRKHKSTDNLHH